jgi:uncharacterized protein YndB with AHSA1/START domain
MKPYRVEITVNADRDTVWRAMTDIEQIRQWFGWDYDGIDGEIRYIFVDQMKHEPPARMTDQDGSWYIELVAEGPRTIVRVVQPGDLDGTDWDEIYDEIEEGWRTFLEQLRFLLDTRTAGRRRTVFLTGTSAAGMQLDGEPWHRSRYQRMVVDAAGHLVVVASSPKDTAFLLVSTYGLDDAAFEAVRDEWTRRWESAATATP